MAAFRYWRINITRSRHVGTIISGVASVGVADIMFVTPTLSAAPKMNGFNSPAPLSATASDSHYSNIWPPWRAFDATIDDNSRWVPSDTAAANKWIQIDFGTPFDAAAVMLTLDSSADNFHPVDFEVWGSATGAFAGEQTVVHAVVGATTGWAGSTPRAFRWEPSQLPINAATMTDVLSAVIPKAQGTGRLGGTLKVMATPAARTVRLYDRRTGELLRTTRSAPDGTYAFEQLQLERDFIAVGLDDMDQPEMKNAAIADRVRASAA